MSCCCTTVKSYSVFLSFIVNICNIAILHFSFCKSFQKIQLIDHLFCFFFYHFICNFAFFNRYSKVFVIPKRYIIKCCIIWTFCWNICFYCFCCFFCCFSFFCRFNCFFCCFSFFCHFCCFFFCFSFFCHFCYFFFCFSFLCHFCCFFFYFCFFFCFCLLFSTPRHWRCSKTYCTNKSCHQIPFFHNVFPLFITSIK